MIELSIIPECYVDTKVAEIVGQANRRYNHQHSCGDVANQLKNVFKDKVALGIIDEDRNKGSETKYFLEFDIIKSENNLILKKHRDREHFLVLICPEMEEWLMTEANETKLNPKDFDLPENMRGFKKATKSKDINKNLGFHRFIKALIKQNAPSITTLKTWIELYKSGQLNTLINS